MSKDIESIEAMMKRLGCKASYISQTHILNRIKEVDYQKVTGCGHLFMFCFIRMDNGFVVQGKPATCMNPENWRDEIGQKIAFDNAFDEIFKLEAYREMTKNTVDTHEIAKKCHEANKAYCESIGDFSQPSWDDAPDWQKDSAVCGVEFMMHNKKITPEMMHENWLAQKEADGWVHGEVKDPEAKTHPCMVPYSELPKAQQMKDFLFQTIVKVETTK